MKEIFRFLILFLGFLTLTCSQRQSIELEEGHSDNDKITIGTQQYLWLDTSRVDEYYGGKRIVNAQVWYPSIDPFENHVCTPYYFEFRRVYRQLNGWTDEDYQFVDNIKTNSTSGLSIEPSSKKYPLIIFSPSLGGNLSLYTYYAERFSKLGYIVIGINHLYESEYVIAPNNEIHLVDLSFHDSLKTLDIPNQITADEYRRVKGLRQKVLGKDILFSIDKLTNDPFFEDRIDVNRIGAFGHSIGGAAVIYASMADSIIKAVIDLDGTPPTAALNKGINVPLLFIEDLTDYKNHKGYAKLHQRRNNFCELNKKESWRILFRGIHHNSFLDINYHSANTKEIRKEALHTLNRTFYYMDAFFSHYLNSNPWNIVEVYSDSLEIIKFSK